MEDLLEEIGKELPPADVQETYQFLGKILGNILANPGEVKFRNLKKDNKLIVGKILRSQNAVSLLLAIGFDDDGLAYTLPLDAELEDVRTLHDLIECMLLSSQAEEPEPVAAPASTAITSDASKAAVTAVDGVAAAAAAATVVATEPAKKAPVPLGTPEGFMRRNDAESKRQEQIDQLQAARQAQRAQYEVNPQGPPPPTVTPGAKANGYPTAASDADAAAKKPQKTAFDFENRGKKEQERVAQANSLEEMRKAQKNKFKDFQADPNAKQQEAYKAPPCVAAGAQEDSSWGGWFGGMFGGGSSSTQPKPQKQERQGPRIKGVGDLPKPVQRGG